MSEQEKTDEFTEQPRKKLYQRPDFRFERVFETRALTCGKLAGSEGQCQSAPKVS